MDIQDLRIFARLARVQNLSAVGAEFDLSAGTISKRLQALEAELSVRLFDRTTRSISLTEEGEKLLSGIETVLLDLRQALETVQGDVARPRGRLRVSAPTSLGRGMIAPAICSFLKSYPEIDVQLDLTDRVVTFPDSGYDVAIRTGQLEDSSLFAKRLAADPQVVVASPEYLEAHGQPVSPDELAGHIREAVVAPLETESQALVVESDEVHDRGLQIMDAHLVTGDREAEFVGFAERSRLH